MSYGLQVFNSGGSLALSITDRLTRYLYSQKVTAGSSGSFTVTGFDAARGVAFATMLPMSTTMVVSFGPDVTATGSTVSWSYNASYPSTWWNDALIMVFMYE